MAHFSKDASLVKAFENNEDIHSQTAAEIFGLPLDKVTSQQRREAKTINFGVIYGQGPFGLGKQLGIPQGLARDFIERYFQRFPGIKKYIEETKQKARSEGLVSTWFGRRRYLPGLASGGTIRSVSERMAINTRILGTAADIIKMAMLLVNKRLKKEFPQAQLLMQVHDELIIEAPIEQTEPLKKLLKEEMTRAGSEPPLTGSRPLEVPLSVDVTASPNWTHA
jgi:DNA polymerase-1